MEERMSGVTPPARIYAVAYYTPDAPDQKREEFPDDLPGAEARALELGKTLDWLTLTFGQSILAYYGRSVNHGPEVVQSDRRGRLQCGCLAIFEDDAALARHREIVGWESA